MNPDWKTHIESYRPCMYSDGKDGMLRTGDVIELGTEDIKKIARHSAIYDLFKAYSKDSNYSHELWSVLNKACDMVHEKGRYFSTNLFLCPLQGLLSAIERGTIEGVLKGKNLPKSPINFLETKFINFAKKELSKEAVNAMSALFNKVKKSDGIKGSDPSEVLEAIIEALNINNPDSNAAAIDALQKFKSSTKWELDLQEYKKDSEEESSKIIIESNPKKLISLSLNQFDSKGIFFYEPSKELSSFEHDMSYIIQLEDMITLKIKEESQKNGELLNILKANRKVSLSENFSDRLLNIMGNYFSKIATKDVIFSNIAKLYTKVYPERISFQ